MANTVVNVDAISRNMKRKQETISKNAKKRKRVMPKNLRVGWTDKSGRYTEQRPTEVVTTTHKDGTSTTNWKAIKVKDVARIHEYGLGNQTEKAFIRTTKNNNMKKWLKYYRRYVLPNVKKNDQKKILASLTDLGEIIREDLKNSVYDIGLVDTGRLVESILIEFKGR